MFRRKHLQPSDLNFDPSDTDVLVFQNGTVIIPAGALTTPLYGLDNVPAVNMGGLGHMIAKHLIQRLRLDTTQPEPQCREQGTSEAADVFENLLALECARHVMNATVARNESQAQWLPMLLNLTPAKQFFTVGCFKDCRRRRTGIHGSCDPGSLLRLPSFANAFGCQPAKPACQLP